MLKQDLKSYLWKKGELSWKLDPLQRTIRTQIHNHSRARKICILSSRQIGKSYSAVVLALEYCLRNPQKIVRIVAPTLKQAADIVNDNLNAIIQDAPEGLVVRQKAEYRWQVGSSSLRIGALDRAHVDNNRGGNASLIIYEECGFVRSDDFKYAVESVFSAQLLRSNGVELYISSPAEEPDHYLHEVVKPLCEESNTFFKYTVFDSPSISQASIDEAIRRSGGTHTESFRREYLAEIVRGGSQLVVPDFNDTHVKEIDIPVHQTLHYQADWGGVRDKTVFLLMSYDYFRNKILVHKEKVFEPNTNSSLIMESVVEWEKAYPITSRSMDCPGQLQVDLAAKGITFIVPDKSDWRARVNQMNVHFSLEQIEIDPSCEFLIRSLRNGRFNEKKTDFNRTQALGHCDALAALMDGVKMIPRLRPTVKISNSQNHFAKPRDEKKPQATGKNFTANTRRSFR